MNASEHTRRWLMDGGRPVDGWWALTHGVTHEVFFHAESNQYLKRFKQRAQYQRERDALAALHGRLPGVPRLLGSNDALRSLLTAACPGVAVAQSAPIDAEVWAAAGSWLAGLHSLPVEGPWLTSDDMPLPVAMQHRWDRLLLEIRQLPLSAAGAGFSNALQKSSWPTELILRVPSHRDFEPRNWLWSKADSTLWVVDFEHFRPDAPAVDLAKVLETCGSTRSESWIRFQEGYSTSGGQWPADGGIQAAFVHHAAQTWIWGERHGNRDLIRRGLTMLERLGA